MSSLVLTKHHGAGNDFLVLVDVEGRYGGLDGPRLAAALCDRRRGIGADGLIIGTAPGDDADVAMALHNADGSRAEMSGNGIRCLAQAVLTAGVVTAHRVRVTTDVGTRVVDRIEKLGPTALKASVDMGPVKVVADDARWVGASVSRAAVVDTGNRHVVLLDREPAAVAIERRGPEIQLAFDDGINVEWIAPGPGSAELVLRVWERGAGATQACGTGSCAAAAAAHHWGLTPATVTVHNPGGDLTVELGETAVLTGEAVYVATVEVPWP